MWSAGLFFYKKRGNKLPKEKKGHSLAQIAFSNREKRGVRIRLQQTTAEIVVIGNELLNGTVLDTNSHWLSGQLTKLGLRVTRKTTVPDLLSVISSAFVEAIERKPNWIISAGGLGPTYDDMTFEGLAKAVGTSVKENAVAVEYLIESQKRRLGKYRRPTKAGLKMATIPIGSIPLSNPAGSAPAVLFEKGSTKIVSLPGVPWEMKAIFLLHLKPKLESETRGRFERRETWLSVSGVGESRLASTIERIAKKYAPEIYVKSHPSGFRKGAPILRIQFIQSRSCASEGTSQSLSQATKDMMRSVKTRGGVATLVSVRGLRAGA
jgi:nicotinamide-nucleotide amidase